ncbi:olfactory receptor 1571-like [Erpetoichthys calabaricus]|uniref:olfactory receptor 1571-like n=1 Tax=Erpetoichthys calabaricus TaxID=27687 RepID=UPI002234E685|nr:olfactory receptor 1571-like [Erpetoichthys calabaricus]
MTFVQPQGFNIAGFQSLLNYQYFFIFLLVVYMTTLFSNGFLMAIILFVDNLHTPKYIAIFNLSIIDVGYSTTIIPKSAEVFLSASTFVKYESCLTQMFFVLFFSAMESFSIAILAYDRLISICFPLHCKTINTNSRMVSIIVITGTVPLVASVITVYLLTHLSFCNSVTVNSYYCDYGPMFNMACNDNTPNWAMAYFSIVVFFCGPLTFILISYVCIVVTLLKIASATERQKAFKTCIAHLLLVGIFFIPLLGIYITSWAKIAVSVNTRIFNTSLAAALPPLLNPIIYTLKTEEIMNEVKKLFNRRLLSVF